MTHMCMHAVIHMCKHLRLGRMLREGSSYMCSRPSACMAMGMQDPAQGGPSNWHAHQPGIPCPVCSAASRPHINAARHSAHTRLNFTRQCERRPHDQHPAHQSSCNILAQPAEPPRKPTCTILIIPARPSKCSALLLATAGCHRTHPNLCAARTPETSSLSGGLSSRPFQEA